MRKTESGLLELWRSASTPRPSCPTEFDPQQRICPVVVVAHVFDPPAATIAGWPTSSLRAQHPRPPGAMHSTCDPVQLPAGGPPSADVEPSGSVPLDCP